MSLRELVEGECGRPNSLVHLASHFIQDRGHKDDGLRHPYTPEDSFANPDTDQLVQQFLGETLGHSSQTFRMDALLQEMREIESAVSVHAPVQAPGVATLAAADPIGLAAEEDFVWAEQYLESGKHFDEEPHEDEIWNVLIDKSSAENQDEVFELGFGPKWAEDYLEASEQNLEVDQSWLEQAEDSNNAASSLQVTANQLLNSVDDSRINYSKFMKFMQQVGDGEVTIEAGEVMVKQSAKSDTETTNDWAKSFLATTRSLDPSTLGAATTASEIEAKSNENEDSAISSELWRKLHDDWEKILKSGDLGEQQWVSEYSDYYDPFKEYPFELDNPMKDNTDALAEGKKRLEVGDLTSAVLCFEAAVDMDSDNSEAWQLLGISQAENEQDPAAIAALKNCLRLDPSNLKALMALAISYTNESYQNQACLVLKEWLKESPEYKHLVPKDDVGLSPRLGPVSSLLTKNTHKEVQELYMTAARLHPSNTIDPDVQCGLGVLFNLSSEYDKAVDCFRAALQVRQFDYRIWNRLGATLANGDRSEEAVDAYHHALQLSPGYIRARYNLGITCLNLSAHREAAEHLLTALNQQAQATGIEGITPNVKTSTAMSDTIWSTLRLTMSLLNQKDLYEALDNRDLKTLNEAMGMDL